MSDKFINGTGLGAIRTWILGKLGLKQDALVSGTNIKTVNSQTLLGSGDIDTKEFFIVNYQTYYPSIKQALDDGKEILIKQGNIHVYPWIVEDVRTDENNPYVHMTGWNQKQLGTYDYKVYQDHWEEMSISLNTLLDIRLKRINNGSIVGQGNIEVVTPEDIATDSTAGIVKTNSAKSISLNENGQLEVGGRLGQFPNGGVFYPDTIEPTNVGASSFLMSDGAKNLSLAGRHFGIMAGANVTCKSAAAGATQYRVSNTQTNRFALFAAKGGRVAIDQTDATNNGTALITDISFANGNPISAYFGATESSNDIIITVDRTVNPSAATTKLRVYGTSTSSDVIVVGQGCGAGGGKAISLGQSCYASGNQCIAFGNASLSLANNSVAFGHTQLVNKQFCFAAGQGHDFTNGSNGAGAVGICSEISNDTAFAVGNGVFNSNGNITRSNALEVKNDGSIVLKSPNGTKYKIAVDDSGNLTTTAV